MHLGDALWSRDDIQSCTYFMLLCIHIYADVNRFLRYNFNSWLPFHLLHVYNIFIRILRKCLLILCIISLPNPVYILGPYQLLYHYTKQ
jgi:hypothetical protein